MVSYGDFLEPTLAKGPCQCPRDKDLSQCNVADYLVTMFYDTGLANNGSANNTNIVAIGKHFQSFLIADPENGDLAQSKEVYKTAMVAADMYYSESGNITDPRLTAQMNTLCPNKQCGALNIELFQDSAFSPLTPGQLNLFALAPEFVTGSTHKRIMCTDVLYLPDAIGRMIESPPVQLVQPFLNCHNDYKTALLLSIGVAQGYAQLVSGMVTTVVAFFVINYINRVKAAGNPDGKISKPKSKADKEKKEMAKAIAQLQAEFSAFKEQQASRVDIPVAAPPSSPTQATKSSSRPKKPRRERSKAAALQGGMDVDSDSDSDIDSVVFGDPRRAAVGMESNSVWCMITDILPTAAGHPALPPAQPPASRGDKSV